MHHEWLALLCAFGDIPPELVFADMTLNGKPYKVGCPMGMPISWSLLQITHWAIATAVDPQGSWTIRGDDLIAYWTPEMIQRYEVLVSQVGFKLNRKKTFMAPLCGVFCEELYMLVGRSLVIQSSLSVRFLVSREGSKNHFLLNAAEAIKNAVDIGFDRYRAVKLLGFVYANDLAVVRRYKVPTHLPVALGGLGFPPKDPSKPLNFLLHRKVDAILTGAPVLRPRFNLAVGHHMQNIGPISQIKYSVSDNVDCPHLESLYANLSRRAGLMDVLEGAPTDPIGIGRLCKLLESSWVDVPLGRPPKAMERPYTFATAWELAKRLLPQRKSLQEALLHECQGRNAP